MPDNLFKRGPVWWGRIQIAGRDYKRSLRTRDRAEAKRRLKDWLQEASHARYYGTARLTWKAAVTRFVEEASAAVKLSTMKRYQCSLRQCDPVLGDLYVDEITRKTVAKLVSAGQGRGATNATKKRDLTAVSRVLASCVMHGEREDNPAKEFDKEMIRERRSPRALPPDDEVAAYQRSCPGNLAQLVQCLRETGMRLNEGVTLERRQVRGRTIDLTKTKTDAPRAVPLTEQAAGTIAGTPAYAGSAVVFWHGKGEQYHNASSQLAAIRKRLGYAWTVHDLRHLFAVEYLRNGVGSIYDLQKVLGHSSIRTTEIYLAYLTPEEQERAKRAGTKAGTDV